MKPLEAIWLHLASRCAKTKPICFPVLGQGGVEAGGNNDGINLTDANVRELKLKAIAARNAEVRELAKEMPKFFNSVYATLSQESKQLVQAGEVSLTHYSE